MEQTPAYYRARLIAIKHLVKILPKGESKNSPRELLKQGYIPIEFKAKVEELIKENIDKVSNEPLTFTEQTSYSGWFAQHPEKICGTEQTTSSLYFPVTVKGTEQQIVDAIHKGIEEAKSKMQSLSNEKKSNTSFENELKLLEVKLKNEKA